MNKSFAIVAATALLFAARMPSAQDTKPAAPSAAVPASPGGSQMNMTGQMGQMDEHMQMMKALHEKLQSATTPEARKIVMDKQLEEMQGCMAMTNQMKMGDGKMGGMGGAMMAQKGMPADAGAQMPMIQKRMDMMEMMMQAMMDQQGMMAGPKSPATAPTK